MTSTAHRPLHQRSEEERELDPSHLPVDPEDGMAPGGVTGEPDQDGIVDPEV